MNAFKNLGTSFLLKNGQFPDEMIETLELIENYFGIPGKRREIGSLVSDLLQFNWGGITEADKLETQAEAQENDYFNIHQDLNSIFSGRKKPLKILIQYDIGESTIITNPKIILDLLMVLGKLPSGSEKVPAVAGRKPNNLYTEFLRAAVIDCSQFIRIRVPDVSLRDQLFFTGLILSLAGIYENPRELDMGRKIENTTIPIVKGVFYERLKYYKPVGK